MGKSRNLSKLVLSDEGDVLSKGLYQNNKTIEEDYVVEDNYNAVSAGPITVASGVSVTVPTGSRWVVV